MSVQRLFIEKRQPHEAAQMERLTLLASTPAEWRDAFAVFARPQPLTWPMAALFAPWSLVYASLFLAAILPVFVVHQPALLNRTVLAYLGAWIVSLGAFVAYPTIAPAHPAATGAGFFDWGLRTIWGADVPYNCFPSLHVAQCFLAAFACSRVHAGVGRFAFVWACLVALSTAFGLYAAILMAFVTLWLASAPPPIAAQATDRTRAMILDSSATGEPETT